MTELIEGDLAFYFDETYLQAYRFDDDVQLGKVNLKRVDFIAEKADKIFFIEVKDPDNPCTPLENKVQFREQLISGKLIPSLVEKYRHTHWFYLHTDSTEKPIYYVVLLSLASLDPALLVTKQDELRRSLPQQHPQWVKPCVKDCIVLNEDSYKAYFGGHALKRVSGK